MISPPLVQRALVLAEEQRFERSCIAEVGQLLHVLASLRGCRRVAEIGTGCGVGTAWLASSLPPGVPLFTVELDDERAAAVAELFQDDGDVHVLAGDWRELLPPQAPFDLVFFDAAKQLRPREDGELVVGLLAPGGLALLDDLTPARPAPDPIREFWLGHPQLAAVELLTTPTTAAILAARR